MPPDAASFPPEVAAALARGELLNAIRILRDSTGLGLADAKRVVEAYAMQQQSRPSGASSAGNAQSNQTSPSARFVFPDAAKAAIASGDFISAIAMLRSANPHLDLKTAKDAIDHYRQGSSSPRDASQLKMQAHYRARVPTVMAGDRGSHGWVMGVVAVAVAALVWWLVGGT